MIIQCQACNTKFRVGEDKVKPPGIKVRCSKCGEVFFYEYNLDDTSIENDSSSLEQPSEAESTSVNEIDTGSELSEEITEDVTKDIEDQEITEKAEEPVLQTEAPDQDEIPDQHTSEPTPVEAGATDSASEEFSKLEVESIETYSQTTQEEDDLSHLSKEIMAAQIGTDIDQDEVGSSESNKIEDAEMDSIDELINEDSGQDESINEIIEEAPQPPDSQTEQPAQGSEFRSTNLVVDQDVLEQTHTKGKVASSQDADAYYGKSVSKSRMRRYPRRSRSGGFFKGFFKWVLGIVFLGVLFFTSMFVLNEMNIYPNNYYSQFSSIAGGLIGKDDKVSLRNVRVMDDSGKWFNSKYGRVYVVSGEIINRSEETINYVKLKVNYISEGSRIFSQEVYAGNTLSDWEIKNKPFNALQTKLLRKKGDIVYEDVNNLDGLNFDIQPGEQVPFFSIFPAQDKILGLKFGVEVMDFESSKVSINP